MERRQFIQKTYSSTELFWKMGEGWITSVDPKVEMDRINFSYLRRK